MFKHLCASDCFTYTNGSALHKGLEQTRVMLFYLSLFCRELFQPKCQSRRKIFKAQFLVCKLEKSSAIQWVFFTNYFKMFARRLFPEHTWNKDLKISRSNLLKNIVNWAISVFHWRPKIGHEERYLVNCWWDCIQAYEYTTDGEVSHLADISVGIEQPVLRRSPGFDFDVSYLSMVGQNKHPENNYIFLSNGFWVVCNILKNITHNISPN